MTTTIVVFAAIALFLGLRLYAVLGKRTGHEQTYAAPEEPNAPSIATGQSGADQPAIHTNGAVPVPQIDDKAASGLRAIASADRTFSPDSFNEGAKGAYRMILEAYWAGKLDGVAPYLADDVRAAFAEAAADRESAGEVLDNRLITIERAVISAAEYSRGFAQITVRFDADIASVVRDKEGKVIAGSLSDAVSTHDVWTFSRELRSSDPNWVLIDTDEAA